MQNLYDLTISEVAARVREGRLSPVDLVDSLFERIDLLEPSLQAWITLDRERAYDASERVERDVASGSGRGTLCGVPLGVKDVFYTAGMRTTAASPLYANFVPGYDATCVARLKDQGAIVLGKTMTTQFALADPTPTHNPWNDLYNPGGSSTSSAVAVAARMCPGTLANQTGGSTLRPASYNGVVGLKPTYGRISKHGMFPCAWSNDTVGIITRTVEDAALMLQAMAGHDFSDPSSSHHPVDDFVGSLERLDRPPRIGLIREHFLQQCDDETRRHVEEIAERFASKGAVISEVGLPGSFGQAPTIHRVIGGAELAAVHEESFRANPESYAPNVRSSVESGMLVPAVTYLQAQRLKRKFRSEIEGVLESFDVVLTPSTPTPPQPDLSTTGDPTFQSPWTLAGLPAISLPSGLSKAGLPMGIQIISKAYAERVLLAVANWCQDIIEFSLVPPIPLR